MKKTNKKGFTLVELLVVIAIIAILSVVSIVGYTSFTQRARESNASTELAQATTFIYAAAADEDAKIVVNSTNIVVTVGEYTETDESAKQAHARKDALKVIRDSMVKDAGVLAERICISPSAVVDFAKKTVTISDIYYVKTSERVYATWTVNGNKIVADSYTAQLESSLSLVSTVA